MALSPAKRESTGHTDPAVRIVRQAMSRRIDRDFIVAVVGLLVIAGTFVGWILSRTDARAEAAERTAATTTAKAVEAFEQKEASIRYAIEKNRVDQVNETRELRRTVLDLARFQADGVRSARLRQPVPPDEPDPIPPPPPLSKKE